MDISKDVWVAKGRIAFWRSISSMTALALRHRRGLYRALTVAPLAIIAVAAFILGRGVGMLIAAGLF